MAIMTDYTEQTALAADVSIGRIVSVTGAKAIVLLDSDGRTGEASPRPDMGTLLAIETDETIVLAIVSALSVPVPAQREAVARPMRAATAVRARRAAPAALAVPVAVAAPSAMPAVPWAR